MNNFNFKFSVLRVFTVIILCVFSASVSASVVELSSPNGGLRVQIDIAQGVSAQVFAGQTKIFVMDELRLETDKGRFPSDNPRVRKITRASVNRVVNPVIKEKCAEIPERYNEASIEFKDGGKLQFRAYDEGIAYRYVLRGNGDLRIISDNADFIFDDKALLTFQKDSDNANSGYESPYITAPVKELAKDDMGNLPALVHDASGYFVLFLEADTKDYPCMWIKKSDAGLSAYYGGIAAAYNPTGSYYDRRRVSQSHDYIAQTQANRSFPWKIFAVAKKETELLANQLVYLLGEECQIADPSWIRPGWVTFDWWARHGVHGVDFKAGLNTATAKYMIDFAAAFDIPYFLFDDQWTRDDDLTKSIPEVDIPEVVRYGQSKNVAVMLWVAYDLFDSQMETALKKFEEWGVKGVKIDFMNRSDQEVVNFYWKAAKACAQHRMVIDFHGAYRPDGLRRAYPNVLTREALIEFEFNGWTLFDTPDHHCTLPFIRNVAGPMDYIPGTMNNATKADFRTNGNKPMGQGTRAHSLAMAVIAESPMQMLSDAQPLYYREQECTRFLTQVPVEWDEIVPIDGKVGDYVMLARRKGTTWYVAAITDWTPRRLPLRLDFLKQGKKYRMELIKDGINADVTAVDYKKETSTVELAETLDINMVSGGGWVAKIEEI
jgi:alpha-glucosidase